MKTQNETHGVNKCAGEQQEMKRLAVVIMTKEDHTVMHERARIDIDKIAQAAGVEMLKTARIAMRRGRRELQTMGVRELSKLLQEIREAKDYESVSTRTGIATGYANAMCHFGLMSEEELKDVIAVIGQAGEQTARLTEIIKPIPKTIKYCKRRQQDGAILILYTCRKGKDLQDAVEWCKGQGLIFDYVNENTAENIANYGGVDTRKIFAHEYIDDKAINPIRERMWARRVRRALQQNRTGREKREHGKRKQYRGMSFLRAERHCRGRRGNDRPTVRGSRHNAVRM